MRISLVDPPAFTPPYDHALAAALARGGADVELITSRFGYGEVTGAGSGYAVRHAFYRRQPGSAGSRARRLAKLAQHGPDMRRLRVLTEGSDVTHLQWLTLPGLDRHLLPPGPLVLTAHDLLPREPRPGQVGSQRRLLARMDAVIVHSAAGRTRLLQSTGLDPARVHVVPHGAFAHLAALPPAPLPPELTPGTPTVLFFGLLRPYKGVDLLLRAWSQAARSPARLWVVGRPFGGDSPALPDAVAPADVDFVPRFVSDGELAAVFRAADLVVLPYTEMDRFDQSGVIATALAFGVPVLASNVGGFGEVAELGAARLVPPGDVGALAHTLAELVYDGAQRGRLARAARAAADGPLSWDAAAARTLAVYRQLI